MIRLSRSLKTNNINGNPAQLRAIEHGAGAACVIAGPGSGKTFVIIKRVIRLIEKGVSPNQILVITFTKAAAITMQQRFIKETDSMYPEVLFGTFHSCFYQILKDSMPRGDRTLTVVTESEKYNILLHVLRSMQSDIRKKRKLEMAVNGESFTDNQGTDDFEFDSETVKALLCEISKLKNDGRGAESADCNVPLKEYFTEIYKEYDSIMKDQSYIDFDDMVLMCHDLLSKNPSLLEIYREKFNYILIDEYQDINKMQFEVVKLLAGNNGNLFVVGDDDQAIYGFRGSKPELMLGFKEFFPGAEEILLNVNYRCAKRILESSLRVIDENKVRFKKDIKAGNEKDGIVSVHKFLTKNDQYEYVAKRICELAARKTSKLVSGENCNYEKSNVLDNKNGNTKNMAYSLNANENKLFEYKDIAVIFRTNMEATSFASFLLSKNIPCTYREKINFFHEKKYIKDILSYLSFAYDGHRRSDFFRIMNQPVRYICRDCAANEVVDERNLISYYQRKGKYNMMSVVQKFFRDIGMIEKTIPYLGVHYIRNVIGFDKYVKDKLGNNKDAYKEYLEDADKLMKLCREYKSYRELKEYFDEQAKLLNAVKQNKTCKNGVQLMTMHASKGLEFPIVFIPDLNEGIVPSRKSIGVSDIEEERRMFYVAITRAKEELYMTYVTGDKDNPMRMSSFLRPLNKCVVFEEMKYRSIDEDI